MFCKSDWCSLLLRPSNIAIVSVTVMHRLVRGVLVYARQLELRGSINRNETLHPDHVVLVV